MYTLNDFFCGCGGLGLGFKNAGFQIVGAWDFDKFAVASYRENVGDHVVQADIQEMHIEDVPKADVWSFGFPCQDLSVAGKQAGIRLECTACGQSWEVDYQNYDGNNVCPYCGGTDHKAASRSGMFFEIMRLLAEAREREPEKLPKVLVAENVKALRKVLPVLEAEYRKAGYISHAQLFNSKYWYVPQNRERYIVVGTLDTLPDSYEYPEEQHEFVPKLSSILDTDVPENFYIDDEKARKIIDQALKRLESLGSCHATITPDRVDKRQNGRRAKPDEESMFTLTAQDLHGVILDPVVHIVEEGKGPDTAILRKGRTEYGKAIRKDYEAGRIKEQRKNMTEYEVRPDEISNTLTTVLKDNLLLEAQERERERAAAFRHTKDITGSP